MKRRRVCLTAEQRGVLLHVRDHDPLPYMRTKAAAILKVADSWPICRVAAMGLNKPYHEDTVRSWLNRYEKEGLGGLRVRQGRGRKPAFSPSAPGLDTPGAIYWNTPDPVIAEGTEEQRQRAFYLQAMEWNTRIRLLLTLLEREKRASA